MSISREKNESIIEYAKRLSNSPKSYLKMNDYLSTEVINDCIANCLHKPKKNRSLTLSEQINNAKFIAEIETKIRLQLNQISASIKLSNKQLNIIQGSANNKVRKLRVLYCGTNINANDVKLYDQSIKNIEKNAAVIIQNLNDDPINFNYLSTLDYINNMKFEIALEVRNHV